MCGQNQSEFDRIPPKGDKAMVDNNSGATIVHTRASRVNRVDRISLSGGLVGMLLTNPRRALDNKIKQENADGWRIVQIMPHKEANLFVFFLQILVLCLTLLLWTWGAGYLLVLEKDV